MVYLGSHVSIAGGVQNAPERAHTFKNEVMQIFTRSPQGGKAPQLTPEVVANFKSQIAKYKIKATYVHAPYYINFASANPKVRHSSISVIREELERCSVLGAKYLMTHLGSAKDLLNRPKGSVARTSKDVLVGQEAGMEKTIKGLEEILDGYNGTAKLLLENSAGAGYLIGNTFEEIGEIMQPLKKYSGFGGICLDTQHAWASGYDWVNGYGNVLVELKKYIGFKNIKLLHGNDSMVPLGSNKDRHEHIGKGEVGIAGFKNIMSFALEHNLNIIFETKDDGKLEDFAVLSKLRGEL